MVSARNILWLPILQVADVEDWLVLFSKDISAVVSARDILGLTTCPPGPRGRGAPRGAAPPAPAGGRGRAGGRVGGGPRSAAWDPRCGRATADFDSRAVRTVRARSGGDRSALPYPKCLQSHGPPCRRSPHRRRVKPRRHLQTEPETRPSTKPSTERESMTGGRAERWRAALRRDHGPGPPDEHRHVRRGPAHRHGRGLPPHGSNRESSQKDAKHP